MKTGIELIFRERLEQLTNHNRTIEQDVQFNSDGQLATAARSLTLPEKFFDEVYQLKKDTCPEGWDIGIWLKMVNKSYKERLIIAGALIAAEIDRLNYIENEKST